MAWRWQNRVHDTGHTPVYYANNNLYPNALTQNQAQTRVSRRMHEGLSVDRNYGIDTTSDDLNSSIYSSPYYINGRYNSSNQVTQTGNSSSVQGTTLLLSLKDRKAFFTEADVQTTLQLYQGKQMRFSLPYNGKIVGTQVRLRNTQGCTGILSIYLSASPEGPVLAETAIDLCQINQDYYETVELHSNLVVNWDANPKGEIYVRMEIWDEISCERSSNPFNTGRYIELAATGIGNHEEAICHLGEKNVPVREELNWQPQPSRPLIGFIYNDWHAIPTNRVEGTDRGATVSKNGYLYDLFCIQADDNSQAELVIYDRQTNTTIPNTLPVDARVEKLNLVQAAGEVYYVDGYSPLQKFTIGDWEHVAFSTQTGAENEVAIIEETWFDSEYGKISGLYSFVYKRGSWYHGDSRVILATYGLSMAGTPAEGDIIQVNSVNDDVAQYVTATYLSNRPVIAPSLITFHANHIWLSGFRTDPNLVQFSDVTDSGPEYDSFVWRFYVPDRSPESTSDHPVTAMVEYEPDRLMFLTSGDYALYGTTADPSSELPSQVSVHTDGAGVASDGDVCSYRGIVYSFDPDEGIRRFTGSMWNKIPASLDNHIERVDMSKPRKLWGYAYKLYFNYTDRIDGKAKCIVWDMSMNYQQFPWFMDVDLPFCDVRAENDYNLVGIHPDYPCIMRLYDQDVWKRLDSPIIFERHTKHVSLPGNASDMILKRVFVKVIANTNRWWWLALSIDKHDLNPTRGAGAWYRMPCWSTQAIESRVEDPFYDDSGVYERYAIALLALPNLNAQAVSVQVRARCKTFRQQAGLVSVLMESQSRSYL